MVSRTRINSKNNGLKSPLPLSSSGIGNRNDNGDITEPSTTSTSTEESRALTSNTTVVASESAEENHKSKVAKVAKIQSKSDIIDYGGDERLYHQAAVAQLQYKSPASIYEYNTMHHSSPSPYTQISSAERGHAQKYSEGPKLEYLHAYQFAEDVQEPTSNGQDFGEELEFTKPRGQFQQQQQQQQLEHQQQEQEQPAVEISKSKQYSYTIRKPENYSPFLTAFHQSQQQQQPQQQALYQPQQQNQHQQQQQFSSFGRETAYLKQTPATVVPQQSHEEFRFQRLNRPQVEKEVFAGFEEDTKPVHIHHHYPVQHIQETDQQEAQPQQQQQQNQFVPSQPIRSQYQFPSAVGGGSSSSSSSSPSVKGQFQPSPSSSSYLDAEPTPKPYSQGHHNHQSHQSYVAPRKPSAPVKPQWPETATNYEAPTPKPQPTPKWQNPYHHHTVTDNQQKPPTTTGGSEEDQDRERPQSIYPNNIRIEIPEEEIYKHIQNSVHQIIRDLKDKRTKDQQHGRGKPLIGQDQSWNKFAVSQEENKREKFPRVSYNRSAVPTYDGFSTASTATRQGENNHNNNNNNKDSYGVVESPVQEKPRDSTFHQFHHQHQQPQHFQHAASSVHPRIHSRQHDEERPVNNKYSNTFRFEEKFNAPSMPTRVTEETQYESGYPRQMAPATVDITMKNPKKAPVIDLNALDVGQTWNHDSHFDNQELFKGDQTQYFNQQQQNPHHHPISSTRPSTQSSSPLSSSSSSAHQFNSQHDQQSFNPTASSSSPSNFSTSSSSSFGPSIQPLYDHPRSSSPQRAPVNFHSENSNNNNNNHGLAYVGSAISVKDPFPMRTVTPTPAFFKASQPAPLEPEVPEVDILHGMLPVVTNQYDNGNRVMKVILDPSKMPRELLTDVNPNMFQQQDFPSQLPNNVQTIQYNMNQQHLSIPIVPPSNGQYQLKQQQQHFQDGPQSNYLSFGKEQRSKDVHGKNKMNVAAWSSNNIPEGSANVIQYLPPPPLPASRSLLPYDSYSPIYNEDVMGLGKATLYHSLEPVIMRNKRHRGSEELFKKIIRSYPRNGKKLKSVKLLEPSTEMKPPPKYNKFSKKSSL